jgi:hypothetical protein
MYVYNIGWFCEWNGKFSFSFFFCSRKENCDEIYEKRTIFPFIKFKNYINEIVIPFSNSYSIVLSFSVGIFNIKTHNLSCT